MMELAGLLACCAVIVGMVAGIMFKQAKARSELASKPQQMTFPVTPSEGDRYASSNGSWVFTVKGWELG
jgi:hypothetical protein